MERRMGGVCWKRWDSVCRIKWDGGIEFRN